MIYVFISKLNKTKTFTIPGLGNFSNKDGGGEEVFVQPVYYFAFRVKIREYDLIPYSRTAKKIIPLTIIVRELGRL